jgi:hypothetical protein
LTWLLQPASCFTGCGGSTQARSVILLYRTWTAGQRFNQVSDLDLDGRVREMEGATRMENADSISFCAAQAKSVRRCPILRG